MPFVRISSSALGFSCSYSLWLQLYQQRRQPQCHLEPFRVSFGLLANPTLPLLPKNLPHTGNVNVATIGAAGGIFFAMLAAGNIQMAEGSQLRFQGDLIDICSSGSMESGQSVVIQTLKDLVLMVSSPQYPLRVRDQPLCNGEAPSQWAPVLLYPSRNFNAGDDDQPNEHIFPWRFQCLHGNPLRRHRLEVPDLSYCGRQNLLGNLEIGRVNFIPIVHYDRDILKNRA